MDQTTLEQKEEYVRLLEQKLYLAKNLPHIHGFKFYQWQHDFVFSTNRMILGSSANQIGKSTGARHRSIRCATDPEMWKRLWGKRPKQGWLMFTDLDTATREFETKIVEQYMPRGEFERHPQYGWKAHYDDKKKIHHVVWNTGVHWYFKSYEQKADNQQSSTVDWIDADEEMPEDRFAELYMRLVANNGYYWNMFTPTKGEEYLRLALQPDKHEVERFPEALKFQISMYDCLKYMDGTPSDIWTLEKIEKIKAELPSEDEIQRRVYGKYILTSGRTYQSFSMMRNFKPVKPIPEDWLTYSGVDYGSGGAKNHPAAALFLSVSPDYKRARVTKCWRGDGIETTSGMIVDRWMDMSREGLPNIQCAWFDYSAPDIGLIAGAKSLPFIKANKSQQHSQNIINTLFKNGQLIIDDTPDNEGRKLAVELRNLTKNKRKQDAKDDLIDALRYAVAMIPWQYEVIKDEEEKPEEVEAKPEEEECERTKYYRQQREEPETIHDILNEAASMFEDYYG